MSDSLRSRRAALKAAALLPFAGVPPASHAAPVLASTPIAGHFTHESVRIWLQATGDASGALHYWPSDPGRPRATKRMPGPSPSR